MTKPEFFDLIDQLIRSFPGTNPPSLDAKQAWFEVVCDIDQQAGRRAVAIIAREVEFLRPGHNLGALLRSKALPIVTQATIEQHLDFAIYLARTPGEDPYGYLRKINPALLAMAERSDLFARDLSTEAKGFRVRDVAKQFQERRENEKRGFTQAEPVPPERQITGPGPFEMTEEQREANRIRAKGLAERFGRKLPA